MEQLNEIIGMLNKYDRYLQSELREPTDKNVALYEHWIDCAYDVEKKIKEIKALEEQGELLKLPCAVGDKLFFVGKEPKRIREFTVLDMTIVKDNIIIRTEEEIPFEAKRIGVDFFLTQEQAEAALQALKETEGENGN